MIEQSIGLRAKRVGDCALEFRLAPPRGGTPARNGT